MATNPKTFIQENFWILEKWTEKTLQMCVGHYSVAFQQAVLMYSNHSCKLKAQDSSHTLLSNGHQNYNFINTFVKCFNTTSMGPEVR